MQYVLVNTFMDYRTGTNDYMREVSAVYGPYPTREAALNARDEMDFPHPEYVFVRPINH